jgi:hypothetical protein
MPHSRWEKEYFRSFKQVYQINLGVWSILLVVLGLTLRGAEWKPDSFGQAPPVGTTSRPGGALFPQCNRAGWHCRIVRAGVDYCGIEQLLQKFSRPRDAADYYTSYAT